MKIRSNSRQLRRTFYLTQEQHYVFIIILKAIKSSLVLFITLQDKDYLIALSRLQKCSYISKEMRKTLFLQLSIARNDGYVGGSQYSPVLIKLNFHKILPFLFDTAKVALKKF